MIAGMMRVCVRASSKKTIHLCSRQVKMIHTSANFLLKYKLIGQLAMVFFLVFFIHKRTHAAANTFTFVFDVWIHSKFFIRALKTLLERARQQANKQSHAQNERHFSTHWNWNIIYVCACFIKMKEKKLYGAGSQCVFGVKFRLIIKNGWTDNN